jgi:hypothetical protein
MSDRVVRSRILAVASRNVLHDPADPASRLVPAILASGIGGLAGTGHRGERAVEVPHQLSDVDLARMLGQEIAAPLPFSTLEDAPIAKLQENQLEELGWDPFPPRQVGDAYRLPGRGRGQGHQRLERVLGFSRKHVFSLTC